MTTYLFQSASQGVFACHLDATGAEVDHTFMDVSLEIVVCTAAIAWPVVVLMVPSNYRAPVETFLTNGEFSHSLFTLFFSQALPLSVRTFVYEGYIVFAYLTFALHSRGFFDRPPWNL